MLAKIGNTDITNRIIESTYSVDEIKVSHNWTDGFGDKHEDVYKRRLKGEFELWFASNKGETFDDLIDLIDANSTNDVLEITLYVSNKNMFKKTKVHYELESKKHVDISSNTQFDRLVMKVEGV